MNIFSNLNLFGSHAPRKPDEQRQSPTKRASVKDSKLSFMEEMQKRKSRHGGPNKHPEVIVHIAEKQAWVANAKTYTPGNGTGIIECCDGDTIHGYVTRNLFPSLYAQKLHSTESYFENMFNSLKRFVPSEPPAAYDSNRSDIIESDTHILIVIETSPMDELGMLGFHEDAFEYPFLCAPIDKHRAVVEYKLRYDPVHLQVCLPHADDVRARLRKVELARIKTDKD